MFVRHPHHVSLPAPKVTHFIQYGVKSLQAVVVCFQLKVPESAQQRSR